MKDRVTAHPLPSCIFTCNVPPASFLCTLSLHDALPIYFPSGHTDGDSIIFFPKNNVVHMGDDFVRYGFPFIDRKSTRLNSSHVAISYAVFCLKKKIY